MTSNLIMLENEKKVIIRFYFLKNIPNTCSLFSLSYDLVWFIADALQQCIYFESCSVCSKACYLF